VIVLGASVGGTHAVKTLLSVLPETFPETIVAVLHRHRDSDGALIDMLQQESHLQVVEVSDKQLIERGVVYIAPADYHLLLDGDRFSLSIDEPVRYARPSIDVLFESAAAAGYSRLIAVILTGGGSDGANGAAAIEAAGGTVLVQSPAEAISSDMPQAALNRAQNAEVHTLTALSERLMSLTSVEGKG
jgi:two-component system, chemotaxis family, protein-glutamate methylesterase/glutaminase